MLEIEAQIALHQLTSVKAVHITSQQ